MPSTTTRAADALLVLAAGGFSACAGREGGVEGEEADDGARPGPGRGFNSRFKGVSLAKREKKWRAEGRDKAQQMLFQYLRVDSTDQAGSGCECCEYCEMPL